MKTHLLLTALLLPLLATAQVPVTHRLQVQGDTVRYRFGTDPTTDVFRFSQLDSVNTFNAPQTYEGQISFWTFATGTQKITIGHDGGKLPRQRVAVTDGTTTKYLQINFFQSLEAKFTPTYQRRFRIKFV